MEKKSSIFKKLESYLSIKRSGKSSSTNIFTKSNSWSGKTNESGNKSMEKRQMAPSGCFSVYVGPEKQRFVIKARFANHPLFKMLLEDAELEYGFNSEGPIQIPCEVDLFCKVLAEISIKKDFDDQPMDCGYGSCSPFSPARRLGKSGMAKGYGSYALLTPPRLLQII